MRRPVARHSRWDTSMPLLWPWSSCAATGESVGSQRLSFTGAAAVVSSTARGREVTVTHRPWACQSHAPVPQQEALLALQLSHLLLPTHTAPGSPWPPLGRVPAPLTSAAAGTFYWAPGQGHRNTSGAVGTGSGSCCKQSQARPSTAHPKSLSTSKPRRVARQDPGASQTEPGSASTPVEAVRAMQSQSMTW